LIAKKPTIPTDLHDRLRIFDARGHKEYREFLPSQAISSAPIDTTFGGPSFYVEPIPVEEEEMGEQDRSIVIVHFAKEFTRLHGIPVRFVVKPVRPPPPAPSPGVCRLGWLG
jgi:ubiquitin carboxyl-terminal hydrolase 7